MVKEGIRLIVGLGNPGARYAPTRHNVGYWLVDLVAARAGAKFRPESKFQGSITQLHVGSHGVRLLKPETFMNRSGQSVAATLRYFDISPDQLLVAHDELDLPVGTLRLKKGGGHAGHNGLRDVIGLLGTQEFWRLRIGIDHPQDRSQVVSYVLNRASSEDESRIEDALKDAEDNLTDLVAGEFQRVMNRLHSPR